MLEMTDYINVPFKYDISFYLKWLIKELTFVSVGDTDLKNRNNSFKIHDNYTPSAQY